MAHILIIDDDKMFCDLLATKIRSMGHQTDAVYSIEEGLKAAVSNTFDIVFLDVQMPDGNGLEALPKIRQATSSPEVIIITGRGDPDGAELAIKNGAWDYIEKASSISMTVLPLVRALQYREAKMMSKYSPQIRRDGIIGNSHHIKNCLDQVAQAASTNVNVLITGETGTGKELFATAIHQNSGRSEKNFVVVDCASLSETLVESMLFGYERGAYTGADRSREGLVKQANEGTLFLDEVGELPFSIQKTFLRVLQEHRFRPLGGKSEVESNFRLVAATNRNLDDMVQRGQFRSDLSFRFRSFVIELPPLRNYKEDIEEMTRYHVKKLCERYGTKTKEFSPGLFEALMRYDWPGNVRELVNTLERTLAVAGNEATLFLRHLPENIRIKIARRTVGKESSGKKERQEITTKSLPTLQEARESSLIDLEKRYLQDLLAFTKGDIKESCRLSGLSRSRLYELLKKYKITLQH